MSYSESEQPEAARWLYMGAAVITALVLLAALAWIVLAMREAVVSNPNAALTASRVAAPPRPPRPTAPAPRRTLTPPPAEPPLPPPPPDKVAAVVAQVRASNPDLQAPLTGRERRLTLAARLLRQACLTSGDPVTRFVLLSLSRDLAAQGGDYDAASWAIDALDRWYAIDATAMQVTALETASAATNTSEQWQRLARSAVQLTDSLLDDPIPGEEATDRVGAPKAAALAVALAAAEKANNEPMVRFLRSDQVGRKAYFDAIARLEVQPRDPDANEIVGRWQCFHQGKWTKGANSLFQGRSPKLKAIGWKEMMSGGRTGFGLPEQIELADAWWDQAHQESELTKLHMLLRAKHWYQQASQRLTRAGAGGSQDVSEETSTRVEQRLNELATLTSVPEFPRAFLEPIWESPAARHWFGPRRDNTIAFAVANGCDDAAIQAIASGLRWLTAHQCPDGHWSFDKYDQLSPDCHCRDQAMEDAVQSNDTAATALGVLVLLGAGHTPQQETQYKKAVFNGLLYLLGRQNDEGDCGGGVFGHTLATLAFCDAFGVTQDQKLGAAARQAVQFLVAKHPAGEADPSLTAWQILALRNGQFAGLEIDAKVFEAVRSRLDACGLENMTRYAAKPGSAPSMAATAAGLLGRQYLGWGPQQPQLLNGSAFLQERITFTAPSADTDDSASPAARWAASEVMFNLGAEHWQTWHPRMRDALLKAQNREEHKQGSWNPGSAVDDKGGGRIYATAIALLTLETYMRHPALSQPK